MRISDWSSDVCSSDLVYYTRLATAYLELGSIDRVEILNGPQGTLFGRNSSGGAIQMFSKDPGRDTEVNATIGYANFDKISGQFYASTPLTRSEEHTSELQSLMRISYAVFCLKKKQCHISTHHTKQ